MILKGGDLPKTAWSVGKTLLHPSLLSPALSLAPSVLVKLDLCFDVNYANYILTMEFGTRFKP